MRARARSSSLGKQQRAEPCFGAKRPIHATAPVPPYIWRASAVVLRHRPAIVIHGAGTVGADAASCRAGDLPPWLGADDHGPCRGCSSPRREKELLGLRGRRRGLRPVPGEVGGGQVVPAVRRVGLPVRARRLRLPPQRPPRRRVPQIPVEPRQLPAAQVRRRGFPEAVAREDGDVRGGLAEHEPVGVPRLHAPRRRAVARPRHPDHRRARLLRALRGLRPAGGAVPHDVPGGRGAGGRRPGAQARLHAQRQRLARRAPARLQHLALVDLQGRQPSVGLRAGREQHVPGHGPADGLLQGPLHMGALGGRQHRRVQDQGLLPGHLPQPLHVEAAGGRGRRSGEGASDWGRRRQLPEADAAAAGGHGRGGRGHERHDAGAGRGAGRDRRHGVAGAAAGHHRAVAAEDRRAPVRVRRAGAGRHGLHALVHRGAPRRVEPDHVRHAPAAAAGMKQIGRA